MFPFTQHLWFSFSCNMKTYGFLSCKQVLMTWRFFCMGKLRDSWRITLWRRGWENPELWLEVSTIWLFNIAMENGWKWPIYRWFTYKKWWFSIAMLNYQRVSGRIIDGGCFILLCLITRGQACLITQQRRGRNLACDTKASQIRAPKGQLKKIIHFCWQNHMKLVDGLY